MFAVGGGTSGKESACQYKRHIGVLQFMGHKELDTLESVCVLVHAHRHTHTHAHLLFVKWQTAYLVKSYALFY